MKVLKGAMAFVRGELVRVDIGFEKQILKIDPDLKGEEIDCSEKIILPAMIDVHVHFRDFNQAYKENWQSGSRAAVKGGVGCVMDRPNTDPPTITPTMAERKREKAFKSLVDFGIYGGITENIDLIAKIAPYVDAFKLYMGKTTGGLEIADIDLQKEVFQAVAETERILAVHAQRETDPKRAYLQEVRDIEHVLNLALKYETKLHIVHVTTKHGVELILEAEDLDLTFETCPHYLFFTLKDLEDKGSLLKVSPPLATEEDRGFLWEAVQDGLIDIIASDHAPHTKEEKEQEFDKAPSGVPGVETTLPLMLDSAALGKISLKQVVELCCANPARRFGFNKGEIEVGRDADFVVVDMKKEARIGEDRGKITTRCEWSPFEGFLIRGWPVMTFVRGELVWSSERGWKGIDWR
jgi:dihydroorotase